MKLFDIDTNEDGTYNIRNVPIFETHTDRKYVCDEEWLDRCEADFLSQKAQSLRAAGGDAKYAMLPPVTIGHTPENPDAPEPPKVAYLDNVHRVGGLLYADFVHIDSDAFEQIKAERFPYRSAEVIPSKCRITNVSLLGGRYPHFSLPVMRFSATGSGESELVRYTIKGSLTMSTDKNKRNLKIDRHFGTGGADEDGIGGDLSGMGGGNTDLQSLASALAPMVATLLAEGNANQEGKMVGAGAYKSKGVNRHADSDSGEHTDKTANAAEDDDVSVDGDEESVDGSKSSGDHKEDFGGSGNGKMKLTGVTPEVSRYIRRIEQANERMTTKIESLSGDVTKLMKHTAAQGQAAKRSMLKSKCREISALGYAIGNSDSIERHVDRMISLDGEGVKAYIDDVLKQFPKITGGGGLERHRISDVIRHGGNESDNERYVADNQDLMRELNLDASVLDIADALG